jgi:transposase-like protein
MLANVETTHDLVDAMLVCGFQDIVQRTLEAEVSEFLGKEWHQHATAEHPRKGHRNGYQTRRIKTRAGRVRVDVPRVRNTVQPFHSKLVMWLKNKQQALMQWVLGCYVRGLSTRDIEALLVDADGRPLLSRSTISTMTDELAVEYEVFSRRRLDALDVVYLFIDGVYESVRTYTHGQTILAAWAICADGHKEMLHMAAVESESEAAWSAFFEDMQRRGLRHPLLIISDGAKGAHAAITRAFPKSDRQRCIAHKMRNLLAKVPRPAHDEVHSQLTAIYYAADRQTAEVLAQKLIERFARTFPAMVKCFMDDLEACLMHLHYPLGHRTFIRTTNLLERAFEEQKRRTKVIPTFPGELSVVKIVFAVLMQTSKKWRNVSMTPLEREQLKALKHVQPNNESFISFLDAA